MFELILKVLLYVVCHGLNLADQLTNAVLSFNKETIHISCQFGLYRVRVQVLVLWWTGWWSLLCLYMSLLILSCDMCKSLCGISLSWVCLCFYVVVHSQDSEANQSLVSKHNNIRGMNRGKEGSFIQTYSYLYLPFAFSLVLLICPHTSSGLGLRMNVKDN